MVLLGFSLRSSTTGRSLVQCVLYPLYLLCGVAILYSLMIALASLSVWLGRNQTLYDFWFYITNFSRYPMEIYRRPVRHAAAAVLHLLHSGPGRGERAGAAVGQAARSAELAAGRFCPPGHGRQPGRLALVLQPRLGQLPQREQLKLGT